MKKKCWPPLSRKNPHPLDPRQKSWNPTPLGSTMSKPEARGMRNQWWGYKNAFYRELEKSSQKPHWILLLLDQAHSNNIWAKMAICCQYMCTQHVYCMCTCVQHEYNVCTRVQHEYNLCTCVLYVQAAIFVCKHACIARFYVFNNQSLHCSSMNQVKAYRPIKHRTRNKNLVRIDPFQIKMCNSAYRLNSFSGGEELHRRT